MRRKAVRPSLRSKDSVRVIRWFLDPHCWIWALPVGTKGKVVRLCGAKASVDFGKLGLAPRRTVNVVGDFVVVETPGQAPRKITVWDLWERLAW